MFPDSLKEFRDYVHASCNQFEIADIEKAILELVADCFLNSDIYWGSDESLDLERVREILVASDIKDKKQ